MEILRSIEKNIIDITNANNDIDADMLKNIKSYFEKMADKENINNMKRDKYYENMKIKEWSNILIMIITCVKKLN